MSDQQGSQDSTPPPPTRERRRYFAWFFFAIFVLLIYQLMLVLSLFADVIVWAGCFALVFWPAHRALQDRLPGRRNLAAFCSTAGVLLLVLVPITAVLTVVIAQAGQLYPTLETWLDALSAPDSTTLLTLLPAFVQDGWRWVAGMLAGMPLLAQFEPGAFLLENADAISRMLTEFGADAARNLLLGIINLLLILVLMYFCFRDGEGLLAWSFQVVPMEGAHAQAIALRVYQTVTAVIRGALLTSFVQGALATVGFFIADVPLALFFGVLTGFAALIPVVGAGLVWLPIGIFQITRDPTWGIFILVWGFFFVSLIDNILKPILIGQSTRMPILLIFCAMIGGANVYGVTGFIIGPILVAVLLAFVTIYREHYLTGKESV